MPNKVRLHQYKQQVSLLLLIKLLIVGFVPFFSFIAAEVFNPPSTGVVRTQHHLYMVGGKKKTSKQTQTYF